MLKLDNPYNSTKVNSTIIHYGNGAKNELKKETNKYNFKFYHTVNNKVKFCSAGFNDLQDFKKIIKPFNKKYYIYEYIMENTKCVPYFDYEFEIDDEPSSKKLFNYLDTVLLLIINVFNQIFKIKLSHDSFKISSSHGFKTKDTYKVSFHIIIPNYYFDTNYECKYLCTALHQQDQHFDLSVYSKDRLMRTVGSFKSWKDERQFIAISWKHKHLDITISNFDDYLITNVKDTYTKLSVPIVEKSKVIKHKYFQSKNIADKNNIGFKLEKIIQTVCNEDTYFTKSVVIQDGCTFYAFNFNDTNKKCFTGYSHDESEFYCYVDHLNNVVLKCFSEKCKASKFIVGNLNDNVCFENTIEINEKYVTNSKITIKTLDKLMNGLKTCIIKSSMGTAKTEILLQHIKKHNSERILIVSTRQSYANNIHKRFSGLKFVNYLDDKLNFHIRDRLIVQLESLHHLTRQPLNPFDLIVLDEIESILFQFSSETILERSKSTFDLLHKMCQHKKTKIVALDADYDVRSHEFIKTLGKYEMIHNLFKNEIIKIELTDNLNFFIDNIKKRLCNKQKVCVIGLSIKLLYQLAKKLDEMKVKYIMHTKDSDDALKKKLSDVNELWSQYDVVLFSPTISVGVDHTLEYFDAVYSIIVPDCASPRIYLQMLGRIRNLKHNTILTYYQNVDTSINKILYNIDDIKDYLKYVDTNFKATVKYEYDDDDNLYAHVDDSLYNKIMMHNKIENMNKISDYFMTCLNMLCNKNNYKLVFQMKNETCVDAELDVNVYKKKIISADNIDEFTFPEIVHKINNNEATEKEKFSFHKYRFKKFWKLNEVNEDNMNDYFRKERNANNMMVLFGKKVIDDTYVEYIDYDANQKTKTIMMIINVLGFDEKDLNIKISRDVYYENVKKLLSDSEFSKNYDKIRVMFGRPKTHLNVQLKGSGLAILLNGYFEEFGLYIRRHKTSRRVKGIKKDATYMTLAMIKKYKNIYDKYQ